MAEGKKSFIAYSDWKEVFDEISNEDAGILIKHIFSYVNDENPQTDNVLIRAVFANIKSTLKRDLQKWEHQLEQRKDAGKKSAEIRKNKSTESNERSTSVHEPTRNPTDSVSVSENVSDSVINIHQQDFEKLFLNDQTLSEYTCRLTHCTESGFKEIVKDFFSENTAAKKKWLDLHDCNKHFISWLRYYKPKENVVIYKKTKINPVHE